MLLSKRSKRYSYCFGHFDIRNSYYKLRQKIYRNRYFMSYRINIVESTSRPTTALMLHCVVTNSVLLKIVWLLNLTRVSVRNVIIFDDFSLPSILHSHCLGRWWCTPSTETSYKDSFQFAVGDSGQSAAPANSLPRRRQFVCLATALRVTSYELRRWLRGAERTWHIAPRTERDPRPTAGTVL